jgi:hypothetical protein
MTHLLFFILMIFALVRSRNSIYLRIYANLCERTKNRIDWIFIRVIRVRNPWTAFHSGC